jgi:integrase/recombinase XerD
MPPARKASCRAGHPSAPGLLGYLLNLKERNYAFTTVARKVARPSRFFSFLSSEGKIKSNPMDNISSPK